MEKKFILDLSKTATTNELVGTIGWFAYMANQSNVREISNSSLESSEYKNYSLGFHYGRISDYIFEICNPSKLLVSAPDLPNKIDPTKVIFEFLHHEVLSRLLTEEELEHMKEIFEEHGVEVLWN